MAGKKPETEPKERAVSFTDQLRGILTESGIPVFRIAKATGIAQPVLSRFIARERGLRSETTDKLGEYFGIRIKATRNMPYKD